MKRIKLAFVVMAICLVCTPVQAAKVMKMEALTVEGQAQKPQVAFILQRSNKINLDVDIRRFRPTFSQQNQELITKYRQLFEVK